MAFDHENEYVDDNDSPTTTIAPMTQRGVLKILTTYISVKTRVQSL